MYHSAPQPAKGALVMARIRNTEVARHLDCSAGWVGRVLNGRERPPRKFREGVAELLGRPEHELFRHDDETGGGLA